VRETIQNGRTKLLALPGGFSAAFREEGARPFDCNSGKRSGCIDRSIESGEGELLRTFRCSVEVRRALHQASVGTAAIEDEIDGLDEGGSLQIPVNDEQYAAFYRKAPAG
jgi:hypothetical protein